MSVVLVGAAALPQLVARAALLVEGSVPLAVADLRGLAADCTASLVIAALLAVPPIRSSRLGRALGSVVIGAWSLINFANYEHVRELGSLVNIANAGYVTDPTFFRGSVLAPTHPVVLLSTTLLAVAGAWWAMRQERQPRPEALLLAAAPALAAMVALPERGVAEWRRTNLLFAQPARLAAAVRAGDATATGTFDRIETLDLDAPLAIAGAPARNVLLVILEGVSGAFLPSVRERHGVSHEILMPELDRIAARGLTYSTFLTTQRQTNRGEYALLCGDYPKLLSLEAKMSELSDSGPENCLPLALNESGFATVYLQAAPLAFMMKDQFMPRAGFEEVHGNHWFRQSYNRNHWGIDDRAFLEQSLDMISDLRSQKEPWFLTLLTVGTHHRYNVPDRFEGRAEKGSAAWAFEYLDLAIGDFVSALDASGVLDDTLVLITSDESQAKIPGAADELNTLIQAWGLLIVLLPSGEQRIIDETFTQPDIPLSVADYLQIDPHRAGFTGRSVFRSYERPREVFWGNTHMGVVAGSAEDGQVTVCDEAFDRCRTLSPRPGAFFSLQREVRAASASEIAWLRRAALQSLEVASEPRLTRHLSLVSDAPRRVLATSTDQYLFGGQFVTLPARSRTRVEMEATLRGASGWVDFAHNFMVDLQPRLVRSGRIHAGGTLRLSYTAVTEAPLHNVECRFWITAFDGDDLALEFSKARLDIEPAQPGDLVPGIVELEFSVGP